MTEHSPKPSLPTARQKIALVAHDNKKDDLITWARHNRERLAHHELWATGTTGRLLQDALGLPVQCVQSGPLGGDQQIGGRIADGLVSLLVFMWDPLEPQPHDPDVKALLRLAVLWNVPTACNLSTADFLITSPLFESAAYKRVLPDVE